MNLESQIRIPSNVCLSLKGGYVRVLGPLGESKIRFLPLDPKGNGKIKKVNHLSNPTQQKGGTFLLSFIEKNKERGWPKREVGLEKQAEGETNFPSCFSICRSEGEKDSLNKEELLKGQTNTLFPVKNPRKPTLLSEKQLVESFSRETKTSEKFLKKISSCRELSLNILRSLSSDPRKANQLSAGLYKKVEKVETRNGSHICSEKQKIGSPNNIKRGTYKEVLKKIVSNKIQGVSTGFALTLKIKGVGFRVKKKERVGKSEKQSLSFKMGYTHQVEYQLPESVFAFVFQQTVFCLFGLDKNQVSQVAHKIQEIREPDIYKGKGIRFADQEVKIKEGKRK